MDYDLSRLNWRSFEQLIQGIGTEVLGPGLVIFGDGPDGGREATINADLPYPTKEDGWNGYTVVQAKFLQRPKNTSADGKWALKQLEEELSKYAPDGSGRPLPDNMIFATNVTLSPTEESGGKDKLFAFATDAGIGEFDVWDYDKIRVYLDRSKELRRSFGPYVLAGDVLAGMMEILEEIKSERPDFDEVISRFLQKELIADQWVNLEQAGRSNEEQVPVSRVFVDLPVSELRQADPPTEDPERLEPGFVGQVLETAAMRLDPETLNPQRSAQGDTEIRNPSQDARLVLVGGPGQGKTTVGQFVCQMFRTGLLQSRDQRTLAPEVKDAMRSLEAHCQSDDLELPSVGRCPVRVELTKFADELGDPEGCSSLLSYLAKLISTRVDEDVPPSLMSRWFSDYPWLLVLDGLDEVPASGNREQMMAAIREFWVDIAGATADCLVIATTRPQGYEDEFSPRYYRHLYLTPLSTARALHYAERLLRVRFSNDADRRGEITSRLSRAAARSDTSRLMTSPLQVTIMATLLERMGQPPEGRWNLFSQYYRVIYDRELEREIPAAWVLRDHRPDIDAIHRRVALLLQAEGENASQAEAQISRTRFAQVVRTRLQEEELDSDEGLVQQIIDAAMERLVFLVPVEADHVGFEIRSLQEFMAAEALLDGKEKIVEKRLRAIAPLSAWRNVFLFAAGRCFSDLQHYRGTINTICGELNDPATDPLAPIVLPGSSLAIDLLEDGVANRQTKYERLLSREALRIARMVPEERSDRLAEVYLPALKSTYEAELRESVSGDKFLGSLGAWRTLSVLQGRGEHWAREILEKHLPSHEDLGHLLTALPQRSRSQWLSKTLAGICVTSAPKQSLPFHAKVSDLMLVEHTPSWYQHFHSMVSAGLVGSSEIKLRFESVPDDQLWAKLRMMGSLGSSIQAVVSGLDLGERDQAPDSWELLFSGIEFLRSPTKKTLVEILERLSQGEDIRPLKSYALYTGWPLSSLLLSVAAGSNDLGDLVQRVRAGELGDADDWLKAQRRWEELGVTVDDLTQTEDGALPFNREISTCGFPLDTATVTVAESRRKSASVALSWLDHATRPEIRQFIVHVLFWMLQGFVDEDVDPELSFGQLAESVTAEDLNEQKFLSMRALDTFAWKGDLTESEADLLEVLGLNFRQVEADEVMPIDLQRALVGVLERGEKRPGLVRLLAIGLSFSPEESLEFLEKLCHGDLGDEIAPARALLALKLDREPDPVDLQALANGAEAWAVDAVGAVRYLDDRVLRSKMLEALFEALPSDRWSLKQDLISMGASFIGSRPSELATAEKWEELELFKRLESAEA